MKREGIGGINLFQHLRGGQEEVSRDQRARAVDTPSRVRDQRVREQLMISRQTMIRNPR
jgi:hypothetical protein